MGEAPSSGAQISIFQDHYSENRVSRPTVLSTASIDVDDMLGAVEAERQIASEKEVLEKALKELRELKSVLQLFMEDLETAIGAECKAEGALKAAADVGGTPSLAAQDAGGTRGEPTTSREQYQACLNIAEARRRKTKSNLKKSSAVARAYGSPTSG